MNLPHYFEDPHALHVGTCENRSYYIPFSDTEQALIGDREMSDRYLSLNGEWGFRFYESVYDLPDNICDEYVCNDQIPVPSVWQNYGYDHHQYTNVEYPFPYDPPYVPAMDPCGVYQRTFEISSIGTDRFYLNFEGVDSCFYVYLNGQFIGYSQVSHSTSEFDVTEALSEGDNDITVVVLKWCDGSYLEDQDKLRMSGIFRDVYLLVRPRRHIRDFFIHTDLSGRYQHGALTVDLSYGGKGKAKVAVNAELIDPDGEVLETKMVEGSDTAGTVSFSVPHVKLWNAEQPRQYTLLLVCRDEVIAQKVGFRKVEVKNGVVLLNGQPVKFRGVNRHDSDPYTGYVISEDQAITDLALMKEHNINAIRTSHYPNAPWFPQLCSQYGFYMIAEADMETHGTTCVKGEQDWVDKYGILPMDERFRQAMLDRSQRNVIRDKNNAAILIWSLGNESGYGKNLEETARWVKAYDPSRLLHYERAFDDLTYYHCDNSMFDLYSRMYADVPSIDAYFRDHQDPRPYVLCEFIHAMGNGPGDAEDYWRCIQRHKGFCGGFVWEWCDHAVYMGTTAEGKPKFYYGGDFGEFPHSGNFCMDGLVFPDRTVSNSLLEYKNVIRPVRAELVDSSRGLVRFTNYYDFKDLKDSLAGYCEVSVDGQTVQSFLLPQFACAPHKSVEIELPFTAPEKGEAYLNIVYIQRDDEELTEAGREMGFDQLMLRREEKKLPELAAEDKTASYRIQKTNRSVIISNSSFRYELSRLTGAWTSLVSHNAERLQAPMAFTIWRAPTDNDRNLSADWRSCGYDRAIPKVYSIDTLQKDGLLFVKVSMSLTPVFLQRILTLDITYVLDPEGRMDITVKAVKDKDMTVDLPRFGLSMQLKKEMDQAVYTGYGPYESYVDKHRASYFGRFEVTARENYVDYLKPQENGSHWGVEQAVVTDSTGEGIKASADTPFCFQILPYTPEELTKKKHNFELEEAPGTFVAFDYKQNGIGSNSCGPKLMEPYRFDEQRFTFHLRLENVHAGET